MKQRLFSLLSLLMVAMGTWAQVVCNNEDIGKVLCSDGSIYATVAEATAAGKKAEAMICYLNDDHSKGLGIALQDAADKSISKCPPAESLCNDYNYTHPVANGKWRLPSVNDWEHMFIGCGSTSEYISVLPSKNVFTERYPFLAGNIRSMIEAAGGTDFHVDPNGHGFWTSTTPTTVGGDFRWAYYFYIDPEHTTGPTYGFDYTIEGWVRACVEFDVFDPAYFKLELSSTNSCAPLNKTTTLTVTATPDNELANTVIWSTSNSNVQLFEDAECTKAIGNTPTEIHKIYVKGVSEGTATITVTSSYDAERKASCEMKVKEFCTLKIKEGTTDADLWNIDYLELKNKQGEVVGMYAALRYSGNKYVGSISLVKSGIEGQYFKLSASGYVDLPDDIDEDEMAVGYYPTIVETEDNSELLDAINGIEQEKLVLNKVFPIGWNIFSAPIDIPAQTLKSYCAIGEIREFVGSSFVQGGSSSAETETSTGPTLKLFFDVVTDGVKAGVPYLVRADGDRNFFNFPLSNVTVSNAITIVESKYVNFIPTFSQTLVNDDPMKVLFLTGGGHIDKEYPYEGHYYHPQTHYEAPPLVKGLGGYMWLTPEVAKVAPEGGYEIKIVFGPYEPEPTPEPTKGDANGDGKIDMSDAIDIVNAILGKTPEGFSDKAADVNGDGKVDMGDVMYVVYYTVKGEFPKLYISAGTEAVTPENYKTANGAQVADASTSYPLTFAVEANNQPVYVLTPAGKTVAGSANKQQLEFIVDDFSVGGQQLGHFEAVEGMVLIAIE